MPLKCCLHKDWVKRVLAVRLVDKIYIGNRVNRYDIIHWEYSERKKVSFCLLDIYLALNGSFLILSSSKTWVTLMDLSWKVIFFCGCVAVGRMRKKGRTIILKPLAKPIIIQFLKWATQGLISQFTGISFFVLGMITSFSAFTILPLLTAVCDRNIDRLIDNVLFCSSINNFFFSCILLVNFCFVKFVERKRYIRSVQVACPKCR